MGKKKVMIDLSDAKMIDASAVLSIEELLQKKSRRWGDFRLRSRLVHGWGGPVHWLRHRTGSHQPVRHGRPQGRSGVIRGREQPAELWQRWPELPGTTWDHVFHRCCALATCCPEGFRSGAKK